MKDEVPHGTASRYTNYKCRCAECKQAIREYSRAYYVRTYLNGVEAIKLSPEERLERRRAQARKHQRTYYQKYRKLTRAELAQQELEILSKT